MSIKHLLLSISIALITASAARAQELQSVYTDLASDKCKTLEVNNEGAGYSVQQCAGVAGYKLRVIEGDLRQTIEVVRPNGTKHDLKLAELVGGGGFSSVGAKAEWRMKRQGGKMVPVALIVRFNVSMDPVDSTKITSFLAVAKITPRQICLVESINPGANANEEARRVADQADAKPCMKTSE